MIGRRSALRPHAESQWSSRSSRSTRTAITSAPRCHVENCTRADPVISSASNINLMTRAAFRRRNQRPYEELGRLERGSMFRHARSHALVRCSAGLAFGLVVAAAARTASPVGTWLTENGHGVIAIAQCGDALCGRIVGINRAPTDPMPTDVNGRPQCGLTIITNGTPAGTAHGWVRSLIRATGIRIRRSSGWMKAAICICGASSASRCSVPPKYGANTPDI